MRISKQRKTDLFKSIHDPITDLRIQLLRSSNGTILDDKIRGLNFEIWGNIKKVLNFKEED